MIWFAKSLLDCGEQQLSRNLKAPSLQQREERTQGKEQKTHRKNAVSTCE